MGVAALVAALAREGLGATHLPAGVAALGPFSPAGAAPGARVELFPAGAAGDGGVVVGGAALRCATRACGAALAAARQTARREKLALVAEVLAPGASARLALQGGAGVYVRVLVAPPRALWKTDCWRPCASASWLAALQPCQHEDESEDEQLQLAVSAACPPAGLTAPPAGVLQRLFKALPTHFSEVRAAAAAAEQTRFQPDAKHAGDATGLWDVPPEALEHVLRACSPAALRALSATCRHARTACAAVIPGLRCALFPHQQAAVAWMIAREASRPPMRVHPAVREFVTAGDMHWPFYVDPRHREGVTLRTMPPAPVRDSRGGLFCDEPGLGKTVTALALVLKTLGRVAAPPEGVAPVWHPAPPRRASHARKAGYYEADEDSLGLEDGLASAPSGGGDDASRAAVGRRRTRSAGRSETSYSRDGAHLGGNAVNRMYGTIPAALQGRPAKRARLATRKSPSKLAPSQVAFGSAKDGPVQSHSRLELPEEEQTWVQCEDCHKWRCLSRDSAARINMSDPWFCALEPSVAGGCEAAQEDYDDGAFHVSEGFLPPPGSAVPHARALGLLPAGGGGDPAAAATAAKVVDGDGTGLGDMLGDVDPDAGVALPPEDAPRGPTEDEALQLLTAANYRFFANVMSRTPEFYLNILKDTFGAKKKARQDALNAKLLGEGLRVTGFNSSELAGYRDTFRELGLETREVPPEALKGKSRAAQDNIRRAALNVWYIPSWMVAGASMDLGALRAAVLNVDHLPRAVPQKRVFLSGATLIVLPGNLIQHWKRQMRRHVRGNSGAEAAAELGEGEDDSNSAVRAPLAVHVIETEKDMLPAHELAWGFDVVLTTFQRLSTEWSRSDRLTRPMLCVHWLRVLLDEGHALGASLGYTNRLQMACALRAERRWIMTGTPTPETTGSGAAHMQPLLHFLREGAYGGEQRLYRDLVQRPLEQGSAAAEALLRECLKRVMIRASKEDLPALAPYNLKVELLDFEKVHARSYNALVDVIQRNLLLADWMDKEHIESLLHASQAKEQRLAMRNVRLASCVGGGLPVRPYEPHIREASRMLLSVRPQRNASRVPAAETALRHGGACDRCARFCNVPVAIPRCACLLCVSCAASKCTGCARCGEPFAMEAGQYSGASHQVPYELTELNPAYEQEGSWRPDWLNTRSTKAARLMRHLRRLGDSTKAIVFSQFLEHLRLVEETLSAEGIRFAGLYAATGHALTRQLRDMELLRFEEEEDCRVLLIDGSSAVGLDLSFCSHVFIMEPVWDASMELQIISRAHRMGQRSTVQVRVMAMRGTVEEDILRMRGQLPESETGDGVSAADVDQASAIPLQARGGGGAAADGGETRAVVQSQAAQREEEALRTRRAVLMRLRAVREPDVADVDEGGQVAAAAAAEVWAANMQADVLEGGHSANGDAAAAPPHRPAPPTQAAAIAPALAASLAAASSAPEPPAAAAAAPRRRVRFADEEDAEELDEEDPRASRGAAGFEAARSAAAPVLPRSADELYARLLGISAMCQHADVPTHTAAVGAEELLRAMLDSEQASPGAAAAVREVYLRGTMAFVPPPHDDGKPYRYPAPQEENPWLGDKELPEWVLAKLCTAVTRLVGLGRV